VNGDLLSLAVPGAKPFAPFPLALSWPGRCAIRSRGLREAGQAACGRRSTRRRVYPLTSRYRLADDDRAARTGIGLDHWHVAAQPTAPSTRQSPGRHFRAVQRHLSPIVSYWRKLHGCRFPRPTETILPGRHQRRPAGESASEGEIAPRGLDGPGTGSAGFPAAAGNGCWLLPAICRGTIGISGHDRPL